MAENSLITNELKKMVGMTIGTYIFRVEESIIRRYAEAIGDNNPIFTDAGYAKKSKRGRLTCPPGFFGWPVSRDYDILALGIALSKAGAPARVLDGGIDYEFFEPIGAGDVLTLIQKIIDIAEKETKSGKMLVTTTEVTILNQDGNIAAKARQTAINR